MKKRVSIRCVTDQVTSMAKWHSLVDLLEDGIENASKLP
jgi:hypothetical protein